MKIFSTETSTNLAQKICDNLGMKLGEVQKTNFSDGEFAVVFNETVRGERIFIIASTNQPDANIMELLQMIRSAKQSSAKEVNLIVPYFGYARQDRRDGTRGCITSKLIADILKSAGADSILTIDIHATQIQGFFDFPSDDIEGYRLLLSTITEKIENGEIPNPLICAPDAGGFKRASKFAKRLGTSIATINKVREKPNEVSHMELVGNVEGKDVIIVDDMIDTAGTLCKAAKVLKEHGATSVRAIITHPVLSGGAFNTLNQSVLDELIITDTIEKPDIERLTIETTVVSCATELSKIINNMYMHKTISS